MELLAYFDEAPDESPIRTIPGQGTHVPVWVFGSSLDSAQLAAHRGLPYAPLTLGFWLGGQVVHTQLLFRSVSSVLHVAQVVL